MAKKDFIQRTAEAPAQILEKTVETGEKMASFIPTGAMV